MEALDAEWMKMPKGPEVTQEELKKLKAEMLQTIFGDCSVYGQQVMRRLIQTLDSYQVGERSAGQYWHRPKHGFFEELPPIGSKVYISTGYDCFECIVREHFADGTIKVFEPGDGPHGREKYLGGWHLEPVPTL